MRRRSFSPLCRAITIQQRPLWHTTVVPFAASTKLGGSQDLPPFALQDTSVLHEVLRDILVGNKSREDLVPWMIRLQRFADKVDPGFNRPSISAKASVEMILYADMLKSCDTLKKVILEGCRLSLPSEVYDGIDQSEIRPC